MHPRAMLSRLTNRTHKRGSCKLPGQLSLEAEKTWLQYECERWGLKFNLECK